MTLPPIEIGEITYDWFALLIGPSSCFVDWAGCLVGIPKDVNVGLECENHGSTLPSIPCIGALAVGQ